ncbi:MAG: ESPR domain-containing protein, partial [Paralcaligenes sp.]
MKTPGLNHVYRLVWSTVQQAFVAVAEGTRSRGKRSGKAAAVLAAVGMAAGGGFMLVPHVALAADL